MKKVQHVTLHNALGESVAINGLIYWNPPDGSGRPFLSNAISWIVDGKHIKMDIPEKNHINVLPDKSGFICFDKRPYPDNCFVLDAYGKERYTLTVPWELTPYEVPLGAKMYFCGVSAPFPGGHFGVTAWIEHAGPGEFYFELDYHKGQFLWGKEIRF